MTEQKTQMLPKPSPQQSHPAKYAFLVSEIENIYSCLTFYVEDVPPTSGEDVLLATHFLTLTDVILVCEKHGIIFYGDERDTHAIQLVLNHQAILDESENDDIEYSRFPLQHIYEYVQEMRKEFEQITAPNNIKKTYTRI